MLILRGVADFTTVALMDSVASARSAGLVFTSDDRPGIRRVGRGTRAVCRKCYVHPAVIDAYLDGTMMKTIAQRVSKSIARTA